MENREETRRLQTGKPQPIGCGCWMAVCVFACVIGTSFQFGYSTGVINAPGEVIQEFVNASHVTRYGEAMSANRITLHYALIVSLWAAGGMLGGAVAGKLIDMTGRRGAILLNNAGFVIGALLTTFGPRANSPEMMMIGRFLTGISSGVATCVAPIYLSEISPVRLRGAIGTLHQLVLVIGIFLSQLLGLTNILGGERLWPYLFIIPLLPCAVQLVLMPFCPESPRYLFIYKNKYEEATRVLLELRGVQGNIEDELKDMHEEKAQQKETNKLSVRHIFGDSLLRRALLIAMMLQLSQQFCGINGVIYYSSSMFLGLGFAPSRAAQATLIVTTVLLLMTGISALLVDRVGRRVLHLAGLGGMALAAAGMTIGFSLQESWLGASYVELAFQMAFVMAFAIGPGSIPWFFVSEIFPQSARSSAMSVATFVNWLANFAIAQTFPFLQKWLTSYIWLPFMVINGIFFILTFRYMPETRAKSIEEIQKELRTHAGYGTLETETETETDANDEG